MIRTKRVTATLATTSAALLLTVAPAHAGGHTTIIYTADGASGTYGGKGMFAGGANPEIFQVCDTKTDGMAASAEFWWPAGSGYPEGGFTLMDDNGASAFCKVGEFVRTWDVPEGATVYITVCRVSGGRTQDCTHSYGEA
ncbi:hypothetical protein [Streptomyces venezuelae]|uniref:hypothetical protein n=1 Tax=Streptomyces venezuelae TaxID=54571 RepID=UPI0033337DF9